MSWNDSVLEGETVSTHSFAITVNFKSRHNTQHSKLTTVYGPCHGEPQGHFAQWLHDLQIQPGDNWMLIGYFNFYRASEDRNREGANYSSIVAWKRSTPSSTWA
jgi:hypothetical protein